MPKSASLTASLVAKKGEAAPASSQPVAASSIRQSSTKGYFKALTVKLDRERYRRLKEAGLNCDKSSQEIFIEALDDYLARGQQAKAP